MNPNISPVYLLRSYAWDLLKANTSMDESDYDGLVPIVPVSEEPVFTQYSNPYIVYGYALNPSNRLYQMSEGSMSFVVYSQNFAALTKVLTILNEAFGRLDDSASSLNKYTSQVAPYLGIRFGSISVGYVEGGTPEEEEGARQSGLINIQFSYFVDYDVNVDPVPSV